MLRQDYRGWLNYYLDQTVGPFELLVAVPCHLNQSPDRVDALLDTAAEWCVTSERFAELVGFPSSSAGDRIQMSTRFGVIEGSMERISITFPAEIGENLTVDATWFVSSDWTGPAVLGWRGLLERVRFGIDPTTEKFYFAELC